MNGYEENQIKNSKHFKPNFKFLLHFELHLQAEILLKKAAWLKIFCGSTISQKEWKWKNVGAV
ncbi:unnamed protein product [Brugia pahangi]|uniref:Uncharacterized protein n=1 Tax=Brugia pahangi TaxID=6280 RepID=A0A158PS76_BRUPA|nr:unnamed protein product [Brugia pahangi]